MTIRKTTLLQIANSAGVSLSTVDRILNHRGGVSPAKEAKVLEWASRLNIDRAIFLRHLKMLRVAVIMQSPYNPFYTGLKEAFSTVCSLLSELKISCFVHYINVIDALAARKVDKISKGYDALVVICPNDPQMSEVLGLISKRIPIVTLVTDLPASGRIAYVGPDNRQAGRTAGELLARFVGPTGGDVAIVVGSHRFIGHEERASGFRSVLFERFPNVVVSATLESRESQSKAGDLVYQALCKNPEIRGIYNLSEGNAAIAHAIKSLNLNHKIVLITHELTAARRAMLCDGVIDAIIDQNPQLEAQHAIEIIAQHFKRGNLHRQPDGLTQFDIFIRENCKRLAP